MLFSCRAESDPDSEHESSHKVADDGTANNSIEIKKATVRLVYIKCVDSTPKIVRLTFLSRWFRNGTTEGTSQPRTTPNTMAAKIQAVR
jgi:hypothetical protein